MSKQEQINANRLGGGILFPVLIELYLSHRACPVKETEASKMALTTECTDIKEV